LRQYIEDESLDKKKVDFDTSDWTLHNKIDCPAQENGFDCGVFTCMYMDFTARDEEFAFGQQHMPYLRKRMAYEIITLKMIRATGD
jgi:Ulp1 family protease